MLVTRRSLAVDSPIPPWLVQDSVTGGPRAEALVRAHAGQPGALAMVIRDHIGDTPIADIVTVQLEFSAWIPERFPVPAAKGQAAWPPGRPAPRGRC